MKSSASSGSPEREETWVRRRGWSFMSVSGPWKDVYLSRWAVAGRDGLDLSGTMDLGFLRNIDGLRALRVTSRTKRDVSVFSCSDLEFLHLQTRATSPLQFKRLPRLRVLTVSARSGLETVANHAVLEELHVWDSEMLDLTPLGYLRELKELSLTEARIPLVSLDGITGAPELRAVALQIAEEVDLSPLGELSHLQRLVLTWPATKPSNVSVTLSPLAGLLQLRSIVLTNGGAARGLAELEALPHLRRVILENTEAE